jgi:hypothetical protein
MTRPPMPSGITSPPSPELDELAGEEFALPQELRQGDGATGRMRVYQTRQVTVPQSRLSRFIETVRAYVANEEPTF